MPYKSSHANQNGLQVVVGLGETGLSCLRYLSAQQYTHLAATDTRENPPALSQIRAEFPRIPLSLGQLDAALCHRAQRVVISPGVSLQEPTIIQVRQRGIPIVGDVELFAQENTAPVVAITGSNGKSTVTTLVGEMARAAGLHPGIGGNLGTPALDLLAQTPPHDIYVLELSSFQLETTYSLRTATAAILNISEDHMDRYASLRHYLQAKQIIYRHCAVPIINRDDPITWQDLHLLNPVSFGLDPPVGKNFGLRQQQGCWFLAQGQKCLIATQELKIKGRHQLANALAALALGQAAGLPMPAMLATLREFQGLAHRCQWIANINGVVWYNDSKATNVGAAQAAMEGLGADISGKLIVIAGGLGKNADFSPLRNAMSHYVRQLLLIGRDAPLIEAALTGSVPIQSAQSLEEAVVLAQQCAQPGDAVILAPACASYDMFHNFEHRGEVFMAAVRALKKE